VSRPAVVTRIAGVPDLPVLISLWNELRTVGGRAERAVNPLAATPDIQPLLESVLQDPACRVVLACDDHDEPAGMAVLNVTRPDPLSETHLVQFALLVVSRGKQHRGVGHALIAAAVDFAAERHADHVAVSVYASLRDANRFYARLGFAPLAVRRIAPVGVLQRRLGSDRTPIFVDGVRRRSRVMRPIPPQRARRGNTTERVET
jgi:GNAT superfamily N-acetyltransferase